MSKKNSVEKVQQLLEQKKLIWVDKIYINSYTPLNCVCKICNNECHPRYYCLLKQGGCMSCVGHARPSNEKIKELLDKNNLTNWDGIYQNEHTLLNCVCGICGNKCSPEYNNLQQGHGGCIVCSIKKQKETMIETYGVDNPTKNKYIRLKAAKSANKITELKHWFSNETIHCQGSWEVKVVEYLNNNQIDFLWQPQIFILPDDKTYTPDCYLVEQDLWIEIKGRWYDDDAKQKWHWFCKEYPNSELWNKETLKKKGIL